MGNLKEIDAQELYYVIKSIKNLSEAIYYCSIVEAMEAEGEKGEHEGETKHRMKYLPRERAMYNYPIEYYDPRYRERYNYDSIYAQNGAARNGSSSNGGSDGSSGVNRNYLPMEMIKDPREGRSGERRKMYMEGKGIKDKAYQMKELETYMQELSQDLTEMIQDASPEEKQLLQQKISTLATKIK